MRFYLAFLCAAASIVVAGCNSDSGKTAVTNTNGAQAPAGPVQKLIITDVKKGTGPAVEDGDDVWVRYTGKLANGTVFDSNVTGDKPAFKVSVGQPGGVIKGWNLGLVGMQQGGKRKLSIPSELAYGKQAPGGKIPPNADLYFDIELVTLLKAKDAQTITAEDVKQGTGPGVKKGDTVTVDYEATVFGEEADTTKGKKPVTFKIGADQMAINGFDDAMAGMKVGEKEKLQFHLKYR